MTPRARSLGWLPNIQKNKERATHRGQKSETNMRGRDRRMTIYGAYCMPGTTWAMHIISSLTSYSHMVGPLSPILQR